MPKSGCNLENVQRSGAAKAAEQASRPVGGIGRDIAVGGLLGGVILTRRKIYNFLFFVRKKNLQNFLPILAHTNFPKIL